MSEYTYTVTGDADDLNGWTSAELTTALQREFDRVYGGGIIEVSHKPSQISDGGLVYYGDDEQEINCVDYITERIIGEFSTK